MTKERRPAVDGWIKLDDDAPALIGTVDDQGTYWFPKKTASGAIETTFEEVELSRRGRIWSYTNAGYQPPPPYIPVTDPYEPFWIAAVELELEQMVVLGQMVPGTEGADLCVGAEVELVLGHLYEDEEAEYVTWQWKLVGEQS